MLHFLISALMLSASIPAAQQEGLTPAQRQQIDTLTESAGAELTCLVGGADGAPVGTPQAGVDQLLDTCRARHGWNQEEAALAVQTAQLTRYALLGRRGLIQAGIDYSKIETVWRTLTEEETGLIARSDPANLTPEMRELMGTFPGRLRAVGLSGPHEGDAFAALMVAVQATENAKLFIQVRVRRGMQAAPAQVPGE